MIEVVGSDKAWVAEQLDKLASVFAAPLPAPSDGAGESVDAGGGGPAPQRKRTRKQSGASTKQAKAASPVNEKLTPEMHKKLEEFVAERSEHWKSRQDQAAIIATFLEDELGFDGIDQYDLAAVYEIMGWRAPVNARAAINNARDRNKYFRGWVGGRARLSVTGQNFGRHDSKIPKAADE